MTGFALYRMPYAKECMLLAGAVEKVDSCADLGKQQAFVVAPFAASEQHPILAIQPDRIEQAADAEGLWHVGEADIRQLTGAWTPCTLTAKDAASIRADYHQDFTTFHARLSNGDFQKLVLSRNIVLPRSEEQSPLALFKSACERYPRMFISLVYTQESGLWLAATPEVLLEGAHERWHTVALAGTMPWQEQVLWSDKNLQEQRYVATYIAGQLALFTSEYEETGPQTVRAGHLAHLRSDFYFTLSDDSQVGPLIDALHPTPAVCGLPKAKALHFIQHSEHGCRSYYSGFMGPLAIAQQTHLFVTLRCMNIQKHVYQLYAGGGLLKDSQEEQEWQETETKLDTMRHIINQHV